MREHKQAVTLAESFNRAARTHETTALASAIGTVKAQGSALSGTLAPLIAGKGPVQLQAQADAAEVAAKTLVNVQSAHAHIDWAAAKKITLTTAAGAQIVIEASGTPCSARARSPSKPPRKALRGEGVKAIQSIPLPDTSSA